MADSGVDPHGAMAKELHVRKLLLWLTSADISIENLLID